jgi:hypothetical protein
MHHKNLPFWPFAEGVIVLSVTLLGLKAHIFNSFDLGLEIPYLFDIAIFSFCLFVVLISGIFDTNRCLAVDNKLLYLRAFARVIAFIYVVYSLGVAFKTENDNLFIIELIVLLFLALIIWIGSFARLIEVMRRAIVHDDSNSGDDIDDNVDV